MKMDEVLYSIADKVINYLKKISFWKFNQFFFPEILLQVNNFAVIYLVDITEVPDFNKMYELYDPCTVMFFFRNKHIMIDLGKNLN